MYLYYMKEQQTTNNKLAVLTMGLPGAGKSTIRTKMYPEGFVVIDSDEIKKEKSDYDPKRTEIYHEWSKKMANARKAMAMANDENMILDTTGTNVERMYKEIKELKLNGYTIELMFVQVSLETSLFRNANRERVVPAEVIYEKAATITEAFEIISKVVDKVVVIHND